LLLSLIFDVYILQGNVKTHLWRGDI